MVMPNLLLQQTSVRASGSGNKKTLERRLPLWRERKIDSLIAKCLIIQSRLKFKNYPKSIDQISKSFNNFMIQGKINAALRL